MAKAASTAFSWHRNPDERQAWKTGQEVQKTCAAVSGES